MGQTKLWEAVSKVGTPLSLAALVAAVVAVSYWCYLKHREKLIKAAPESERAELVETLAETYRLRHDNLTREQKFQLVLEVLTGRQRRLRAVLLSLTVAVAIVVGGLVYASRSDPQAAPAPSPLERLKEALENGSSDDAERQLEVVRRHGMGEADLAYWTSRIALVRRNYDVALELARRSLESDSRNCGATAVLILAGLRVGGAAMDEVLQRIEGSEGLCTSLDEWTSCLEFEGLLEREFVTDSMLALACPFPTECPHPR